MEKAQDTFVARNLKRILPVIAIITLIFAALHYFMLSIITSGWSWSTGNIYLISTVFSLGLLLMPAAFFVYNTFPNGHTHPITWAGYIWMGFFAICLPLITVASIFTPFYPDLNDNSANLLCLSIGLATYALWNGLRDPDILMYELNGFGKLKGVRIVQLTDTHVGMLSLTKKWLERQVERVNLINPDIVFITGDLVEGSTARFKDLVEPLKNLKAKHIYFITGNHEHIYGGNEWEQHLTTLGITVLHNTNEIIDIKDCKLLVAGVPDKHSKMFDQTIVSNPNEALSSTEAADYKILLAHQPVSALDCTIEKPDIIFSGHTHGGQLFPFNIIVSLVQPCIRGLNQVNGLMVFISQGTGFWGPPMRIGTKGEISVFEFRE